MSDSERIEAAARGMWRSDHRVSEVPWDEGDPQLTCLHRILASTALDIGDRFTLMAGGSTLGAQD
jgi:hypothetical protein